MEKTIEEIKKEYLEGKSAQQIKNDMNALLPKGCEVTRQAVASWMAGTRSWNTDKLWLIVALGDSEEPSYIYDFASDMLEALAGAK